MTNQIWFWENIMARYSLISVVGFWLAAMMMNGFGQPALFDPHEPYFLFT